MKDYMAAIDIGTTNVKCVVADRKMRVLGEATSEYGTFSAGIGGYEQEADDWWLHTQKAVAKAFASAGIEPSAAGMITVSSQAPTMLPIDKAGKPLRRALIWMDRRSDAQCAQMNETLGSDFIYKTTGSLADPFYTFSELLWFKQNEPELYAQTDCILQCNGYVNLMLTGERTIDRTHASITQCFDVVKGDWSMPILNGMDVPVELMPRIVECDEVIGTVSEKAARETGFAAGTPVLGGSVDGAAAGLEGGVFGDRTAVEMSGTSSVLVVGSDELHCTPTLTYMYGPIRGQHYLLGCMSTSGGALKWYRDTLWRGDKEEAYPMFNRMIEERAPKPSDVYFLPYLAGERAPIWDTHATGMFAGLRVGTGEADMLRAIQEGAAFILQDNIEHAERSGARIETMRAVGGTTRSDLWMKIKASVIGRPIEIPDRSYGAPGGSLAILAKSMGEFDTIAQAGQAGLKIDRTIDPVKEWIEPYRERFEIFRELYQVNKPLFAKMDKVREHDGKA